MEKILQPHKIYSCNRLEINHKEQDWVCYIMYMRTVKTNVI